MSSIPVTVLGPQGSGKTVYLASLFRRLALQRDDVGFFVQLPPHEATKLNQIYSQIVSPDGWPDPNLLSHTSEWKFTCSIRTEQGEVYSPFTLDYLDFAGDHLTNAAATATEYGAAVWQRVEESEFLLVLLDGLKVMRYLDGDNRLIDELMPVFGAIGASRAVAHFLVTKWDLLEAEGYSVRAVLDRLLENPDFHDFYVNRLRRTDGGALRFIPVSSLGRGFATLGPDGQTMVKQGRFPQPLNVEVPFMAVLVDLFTRELNRTSELQGTVEEDPRKTELWPRLFGMAAKKLPALRSILTAYVNSSPALAAVQETLMDAFDAFVTERNRRFEEKAAEDSGQLRARMLKAQSRQEAMNTMITLFDSVLAEFEAANPGTLVLREAL
ncbi:hypothetical protein AB0N81_17520 [Streptomyces sp. NPDC093510]|uniref:hypothetical protein n=1 Tax=Streptomyces sp. NPDC093510 TaxID=3155199 RepID=UPI003441A764